jgi:DNA-binding transcriptional ArsR family regulator
VSVDQLSSTFAALADPTRRAILARLAGGEVTVTELAAPFAVSLPAVSKHLKVLERAGLIARSRSAQWRPCRLEAQPLGSLQWWRRGPGDPVQLEAWSGTRVHLNRRAVPGRVVPVDMGQRAPRYLSRCFTNVPRWTSCSTPWPTPAAGSCWSG